jgi:5-methylcytosine-specific restriction endonuclease McrA
VTTVTESGGKRKRGWTRRVWKSPRQLYTGLENLLLCFGCDTYKPATTCNFGVNQAYWDGHGFMSSCKSCQRARLHEPNRRERDRIKQRDYQRLEHVRAYKRKWAQENKSKLLLQHREYRTLNAERLRKYFREYAAKNPGKTRSYYNNRRSRKKNADGFFTESDVLAMFESQRGFCFYCPADLTDYFEIEHRLPVSKGGTNWPDNLALACRWCNGSKGSKTEEEFREFQAKVAKQTQLKKFRSV